MGKMLTARNATIHTARAEIKTLTIEGKQVTLAVFRQLQRRDLIDRNTGELLGVPWGIVNYFWGDCGPDHLHVVWQEGDHLRRDCVREHRPFRGGEEEDLRDLNVLIDYLVRAHCEWARHSDLERLDTETDTLTSTAKRLKHAGLEVEVVLPRRTRYSCSGCRTPDETHTPGLTLRDQWADERRGAELARTWNVTDSPPLSAAKQCLEEWQSAKTARDRAIVAWEKSYALVKNLEQLFIAV